MPQGAQVLLGKAEYCAQIVIKWCQRFASCRTGRIWWTSRAEAKTKVWLDQAPSDRGHGRRWKQECLRNRSPRGAVSGFSGGRRKGLALKTGVLHAEAVRCAFSSVSLDVKTRIAVHWSPPSRQRLNGQDYARAAQVSGHSSDGSSGMLAGVGFFAT